MFYSLQRSVALAYGAMRYLGFKYDPDNRYLAIQTSLMNDYLKTQNDIKCDVFKIEIKQCNQKEEVAFKLFFPDCGENHKSICVTFANQGIVDKFYLLILENMYEIDLSNGQVILNNNMQYDSSFYNIPETWIKFMRNLQEFFINNNPEQRVPTKEHYIFVKGLLKKKLKDLKEKYTDEYNSLDTDYILECMEFHLNLAYYSDLIIDDLKKELDLLIVQYGTNTHDTPVASRD